VIPQILQGGGTVEQNEQFEMMVVGLGGFGALMLGKLFAEAATSQYTYVTYLGTYGPQVRMGDSECTVILSQEEIASPIVLKPQAMIVMGPVPLSSFEARLRPGSTVLVDGTYIKEKLPIDNAELSYIPAARIAQEVGDARVANLVFLGAYLEAERTAPLDLVEQLLEKKLIGSRREALLPLNKKALREGARFMAEYKE
jgi:2-oxoglutarate ferredoxin oxidoreductase subunit gamma